MGDKLIYAIDKETGGVTSWSPEANGASGSDGLSAYQIAVNNGFTGTEAEWIASLKGEEGDRGEQGERGLQGIQGERGIEGLQGAPGIKGDKGDPGIQGERGLKGDTGEQGVKGDTGLQGLKGDKGDTGAQGLPGTPYTPTYASLANGATAMGLATNNTVKVTPTANATYTTTVPPGGTHCYIIILTSGTTSRTITFGTGFKPTGTLATGTVALRVFVIGFISDGTNLYETSRTVAIVA